MPENESNILLYMIYKHKRRIYSFMHKECWSDDIPALSPSNSHRPLTTKNITHLSLSQNQKWILRLLNVKYFWIPSITLHSHYYI